MVTVTMSVMDNSYTAYVYAVHAVIVRILGGAAGM